MQIKRIFQLVLMLLCVVSAFASTPVVGPRFYGGSANGAGVAQSANPSAATLAGWPTTGTGHELIMFLDWCSTGGSQCGSATGAPPAISTVKDQSSNSCTVEKSGANGTDFINSALIMCSTSGNSSVVVTWASAVQDWHYKAFDCYNCGAVDGTPVFAVVSGPTSMSAGSVTTTVANSIMVQDCVYVSNGMGSAQKNQTTNPFSATASSSFLWHDVYYNDMGSYLVEASAASHSLSQTETSGPAGDYNCIAGAFLAATSGSAYTGIVPDLDMFVGGSAAATQHTYVPCPTGDFISVETSNISINLNSATDTASNTYISKRQSAVGWPSILYSGNITGGDIGISVVSSATANFYRVSCFKGLKAVADPGDTSMTCSAPSSIFTPTSGSAIGCKNNNGGTTTATWNNLPNITPSAADLVLTLNGVGTGPNGVPTSPSGTVFECTTWTNNFDGEDFCRGDGYAWFIGTASTAETWDWGNPAANVSSVNAVSWAFLPVPASPTGSLTPAHGVVF